MSDYPKIERSWVWPDSVERFFREQTTGYSLNVCCGKADVGDVRLDRDPENNPDVVADMFKLPFDDCSFDTVIADPPWKVINDVGKMHKLFFELLRLVKPRGKVLWNAFSFPSSDQAELQKPLWVRQDYEEGKASIIAEYVRYPDQTGLSQYE